MDASVDIVLGVKFKRLQVPPKASATSRLTILKGVKPSPGC
jgi:hypothetical protein